MYFKVFNKGGGGFVQRMPRAATAVASSMSITSPGRYRKRTQENICQGGFHHKNEIPPVKLGLVSQNKVYHIYPTQQSVKNGPPNRVPSRITNYHCQSAAKCDTCLYCFFDSFSFLFIHVYVSSPKFRFIELTRAKYTTNANDIQPSFIGVDSTGKQGTGIYPAQLVGG